MATQDMHDLNTEVVPSILDRIESTYLQILRAGILLFATLLIGYAVFLAISSVIKISKSVDTVIEKTSDVQVADLIGEDNTSTRASTTTADATVIDPVRSYYQGFSKRYFGLFSTKFDTFRQQDQKPMTASEFDEAFVKSGARAREATSGNLNFGQEKADLERLFQIMTGVANDSGVRKTLQAYKSAQKITVCSNTQRAQISYRRGWDSSSQSCANWYNSPIGCSVLRPVAVPVTQKICKNQIPLTLSTPAEIFASHQGHFISLLAERRAANRQDASLARQAIVEANAEGRLSLIYAVYIVGGFIVLMFFFLLIAIERHQRRHA
ncbi:MAG: hypothetical protein ACRYG4_24565 [Janthinobacterium lividum]